MFKVEGKKDLYIACADRWMPDQVEIPYSVYEKPFAELFRPDSTEEERKAAQSILEANVKPADTSQADYVWLPFRFDGEMAYLDWHDEWRIEDYD